MKILSIIIICFLSNTVSAQTYLEDVEGSDSIGYVLISVDTLVVNGKTTFTGRWQHKDSLGIVSGGGGSSFDGFYTSLNFTGTTGLADGIDDNDIYDDTSVNIRIDSTAAAIPTNNNELTNGANYITAADVTASQWIDGAAGDIYYNGGDVGIGISNPTEALHLDGTVKFEGNIKIDQTGLSTYIGNLSGASNTSTGNLGIGSFTLANGTGNNNIALGFRALEFASSSIGSFAAGTSALRNSSGNSNIAIGVSAGEFVNAGERNIFMGDYAGQDVSSSSNIAFGDFALNGAVGLSTGGANIAFGASALRNIRSGNNNVAIGPLSLYDVSTGAFNVGIGLQAGWEMKTGSNNVFLGRQTGYNNTSGSNNVFIGYQAGFNETGSNKLYINNTTGTPLIYGDFATNELKINGSLSYTDDGATLTHIAGLNTNREFGRLTIGTGFSINGTTLNATGSSPWTVSGSDISYSAGNVSIGGGTSAFDLNLDGSFWINNGKIIDGFNSGGSTNQFWSVDGTENRYMVVQPNISYNETTGLFSITMTADPTDNTDNIVLPTAPSYGRATMSLTSISSTSYTQINVSSEDFDEGYVNVIDATERIAVNEGGAYRISYQGKAEWVTGGEIEVRVKKNGTGQAEYIDFNSFGNNDEIGLDFSDIIELNANDYIQLEARRVQSLAGTCEVTMYLSLVKL